MLLKPECEILKEYQKYYQQLYINFYTCNKTQNLLLQNLQKTITKEQNDFVIK